jgi:hypothetical protein
MFKAPPISSNGATTHAPRDAEARSEFRFLCQTPKRKPARFPQARFLRHRCPRLSPPDSSRAGKSFGN